ncbi:hypothetical protein GCM10009642_37130 [Nocardiopsis metallicus]|uniref:Lipoprotein n=1 Tax=Nocardiopsis metallicus TaxID=179819 RepID=A0A840WS03_9ACTN|nr:hypothetical protein [Nocardiopsis metallicus]
MRVPLSPGPAILPRTAVVLSAAALCLTACSTATETEGTPVEPGSSIDSEQAEAALETYRSAQELYITVVQGESELDEALPELEELSSGQALEAFTADARAFEEAGVTFEGTPSSTPEVTGLDTEADPAVATITDCWDDAAWQPVSEEGQPLEFEDGQPSRRVINARAEQQEQGWVLTQMSPEEGRTC